MHTQGVLAVAIQLMQTIVEIHFNFTFNIPYDFFRQMDQITKIA